MPVKKQEHKGVILLEKQLRVISYLLSCYEKYLLCLEVDSVRAEYTNVHGYFKRAMYDNSCLVINTFFGENLEDKDNYKANKREKIHYFNLLQKNSGLGTYVEKIIRSCREQNKESLLKKELERKSGKEINAEAQQNLMNYRSKTFAHQDDVDPEKEKIYFPVLFDFVKNAMSLFYFIVDIYNKYKNEPNWNWTHEYWSIENIDAQKAKFEKIEKIYKPISSLPSAPSAAKKDNDLSPYDKSSRLLMRQCMLIHDILHYYAMYLVLLNKNDFGKSDKNQLVFSQDCMEKSLYAIYSSMVLKIWILFGEENEHNKHTHYFRFLKEWNKFYPQCPLELDRKIKQLIQDIKNSLRSHRNSMAHIGFEYDLNEDYYNNSSQLIEKTVQLLCELLPFVETLQADSYEHAEGNLRSSGGNTPVNFEMMIEEFKNTFGEYISIYMKK